MKGIQGLIVAAALGVLGAALNWLYLSEQSRGFSSVHFIAVRTGTVIHPGDAIRDDHLMNVAVPKAQSENLKDVVYLWQDLSTVVNIKATREYKGGEFLLRSDYKTPRPELALKPFERLIWVTVDSRAFVPELVDPGNEVTFIVPVPVDSKPTPAGTTSALPEGAPPEPVREAANAPGSNLEMIGPFKIGSLGNRLGTIEVMRAGNQTPTQERQIGIIVKWEANKLEPNAMKLQDRLQRVNFSNVGIILHPRAPQK